jgi:hypothetical protein
VARLHRTAVRPLRNTGTKLIERRACPAPPPRKPAARSATPPEKIDHPGLFKAQGGSRAAIAEKTGISKTSLHRYLADREGDRYGA